MVSTDYRYPVISECNIVDAQYRAVPVCLFVANGKSCRTFSVYRPGTAGLNLRQNKKNQGAVMDRCTRSFFLYCSGCAHKKSCVYVLTRL